MAEVFKSESFGFCQTLKRFIFNSASNLKSRQLQELNLDPRPTTFVKGVGVVQFKNLEKIALEDCPIVRSRKSRTRAHAEHACAALPSPAAPWHVLLVAAPSSCPLPLLYPHAPLWHATAAVLANLRPRQDATAPRPHLQRPDGAVHPCTPASPAAPACKHARQVASPIRQWCPPWPVHPAAAYQRPSNPPASPTSSSRL